MFRLVIVVTVPCFRIVASITVSGFVVRPMITFVGIRFDVTVTHVSSKLAITVPRVRLVGRLAVLTFGIGIVPVRLVCYRRYFSRFGGFELARIRIILIFVSKLLRRVFLWHSHGALRIVRFGQHCHAKMFRRRLKQKNSTNSIVTIDFYSFQDKHKSCQTFEKCF